MELRVATRAEVPKPVEEVWAYVVEGFFEHHGRWDPAVIGMDRLTEGPIRVGTRGRETRKFGAKQSAEFEVTGLERPRTFEFRNATGPFALERRYTFAPVADHTQLCFEFTMSPKGPMKLLFPLLRPLIARQVRANIARIPELAGREATSNAPGPA